MKYPLYFLAFLVLACGRGKKYHDQEEHREFESEQLKAIANFQQELDDSFRDPDSSPLLDKHRKDFDGLDFFEPDTSYIVKAKLVRTADAKPFLMPTTTDRKTLEVVYGIAHFTLNGSKHQLEVYQSLNSMGPGVDKDYLFLPFLDETNGDDTYGGGRYIDLSIPPGDTLVIDFNRSYNPLCVYNKKYSCPLVPRQNYLRTSVRAGVKDFRAEKKP